MAEKKTFMFFRKCIQTKVFLEKNLWDIHHGKLCCNSNTRQYFQSQFLSGHSGSLCYSNRMTHVCIAFWMALHCVGHHSVKPTFFTSWEIPGWGSPSSGLWLSRLREQREKGRKTGLGSYWTCFITCCQPVWASYFTYSHFKEGKN